ncbi:MAG: YkgJ family cysteine cluster protein [Gammaproteobacteria bacterium]|nr:YkgJ family cysteine cluster protein [Gammaproteobacteria bacterium]
MTDDIDRDELVQGLLYAHTRANLNTIEALHARVDVSVLLDLLVARGLVEPQEIEDKRRDVEKALREEFVAKGLAVAIAEQEVSKYEYIEPFDIDCDSRIELCKAACCSLTFALSKEDVEEGIVRWDLGRPYMNSTGSNGHCVHLDPTSKCCGVYEERPLTCRKYDCRNDERIWVDFDKRIPNPGLGELPGAQVPRDD